MQCIHVPTPVEVAHLDEPIEGRTDSLIVHVPQGREHVEADEKVVVVVDGVVEAKPRTVRRGPLAEQSSFEIELRAPLDRPEDLRGTRGGRKRRERGERLPAVERSDAGAKAMPPAVLLLMPHEPIDRGPQMRVPQVAEPADDADRVPGEAHLAPGPPEIAGAREPADEQVHGPGDSSGPLREPGVREDEEPPIRRDVLWAIQLASGIAGGDPVPLGMLAVEDLGGPSAPPDLLLRAVDGRIVGRTIEDVPQDAQTNARVRGLREKPISEPATQLHLLLEPHDVYMIRHRRTGAAPLRSPMR